MPDKSNPHPDLLPRNGQGESKKPYFIGIDTGGTFTDICVLTDEGRLFINKARTTPHDFSLGVMDALTAVSQTMGIARRQLLSRCNMFKHSTTVATNALIVSSGARVGFITTKGFEDTTLIGRGIQKVDGLSEDEIRHFIFQTKPEPLVPRTRIRGVYERIDYAGKVAIPINLDDAREQVRALVEDRKVEALAVSFLFSWMNPAHEQAIEKLILEMFPGMQVSLSYKLAPVVREYARANTVILDCYLGKTMRAYISRLAERLQTGGMKGRFMITQANGGITGLEQMAPVATLSSGPAGGMMASRYMGSRLEHKNIITTDMGGTSFDVGLITDGHLQYANEPIVNRWRVTLPMIDVDSIGAGGGTIARVDTVTNRLLVGPKSAAADPGPACYNRGGAEATTSDADMVLGYLNPDYFLGGRIKLYPELAKKAVEEKIARPLGLVLTEAAGAMYDIINSHMADLIRKKVARVGATPEEFVLYSFGGAGPVHAAAFTRELGIKQVYISPTSAVFSAFGCATADVVHTLTSSQRFFMPANPAELNARLRAVEDKLAGTMEKEGFARKRVQFVRTFMMRYRGQVNELSVTVPSEEYDEAAIARVIRQWEERYEQVYGAGSTHTEAGIELVSINVDAVGATVKPALIKSKAGGKSAAAAVKGSRQAYFEGKMTKTALYDYEKLKPGNGLTGPAIVETPFTTVVVPPDKKVRMDEYMNLILEL